ncbi:MAG: TolC family protein [Candidatus Azobacteroides sp.]|nr:TolC family protein [Candidatus Azobacteroides sp.]
MKKLFLVSYIAFFTGNLLAQTVTLSLQDCLNLALERSRDLQIKKEEVKVAEHTKGEAKTAYFPKIDATLAYLRLSDDINLLAEDKLLPIGTMLSDGSFGFRPDQINNSWTEINGQQVPLDVNGVPFDPSKNPEKIQWKDYTTIPKEELTLDNRNIFVGAVSLVQPIYTGGKIRYANRMAQIGIDVAKNQEDLERSEVIYDTEKAYWTVISVEYKVRTAEEYQKLLLQLEQNIQASYDEGMATRADILKVKVKLNEVNLNLIKARNGLNLAKMQLCQMIGYPMQTDIELVDDITDKGTLPDMNDHITLNTTFSNRAELRSLSKSIELSETKEKLAFADYLPQIGLTASYLYTNPDFHNGFEKKFAGSWTVGVVMKVPVLHWGEQKQKIQSARSQRVIAELKLDDTREKIELQYNQAAFRIEEAKKKVEATQSNVAEAEENMRYATLSFEEGLVPLTDVLEAYTTWFSATSDEADALVELRLNRLNMRKVSGTL